MSGRLTAVVAMAALGFAAQADAMQLELSRPELCAMADTVVVGRVDDVDTVWASDEIGGLERHAFVSVEQNLAGQPFEGVVVTLPGGTWREYWHRVEDVPDLQVGTSYALFLKKTTRGYVVVGGEAGAVKIATQADWEGETVDHVVTTLEGCHG